MELTPGVEAEMRAIYPRIFNVCLRLLNSREEAQDQTAQTMLNMLRGLKSFRGESSLYTWAYRIAVNLCKNRIERVSRELEVEGVSLDNPVTLAGCDVSMHEAIADNLYASEPYRLIEREVRRQGVMRALARLQTRRPEYVRLIIAVDFEGLEYQQVAAELGLRLPQVRSGLYHARQELKTLLSSAMQNGEL